MGRRLRYIPEPGTLVEVTCRIVQGRMLLKPNRQLNEMIVGTLARYKRRHGVRICAAAYLSNHAHLLLEVDDAKQLADFMRDVNTKISLEVNRRIRWWANVWGRRFTGIVVSQEPEAQIARLRYVLAQGVKEHLVARCADWPGVHAAKSLTTGRALVGYWFDRTTEGRARRRGKSFGPYTFAKLEALEFDPLPCWRHLDARTYQARIAAMIGSIEADAAADRRVRGIAPLGVKAIRRQNPKRRLKQMTRSAAPAFHAATMPARLALVQAYRWFEAAYRAAAEQLRAGVRAPPFPDGCFPPAMPFVGSR